MIIDQDHFVEGIKAANLNGISSLRKSDLLDENMQTHYRAMVSKLNILSLSYEVKILTTKYGKASKFDIMQSVKLLQKVKRMSTKITIPLLMIGF